MLKIEKEICVVNKKGLHARPAAIFVSLAEKFDVAVTLAKGQEVVNGRSIMGILMLGAVEGTILSVKVEGAQAVQAMEEFEKFFKKQEDELLK
jgi:phosphocarrier protein HPr